MKNLIQKSLSVLLLSLVLVLPTVSFAQNADVDTANDTSCAIISMNLRYGSKDSSTGGAVSVLQDFLGSHGYLTIQPTGFFGSMTRTAVKAFQVANGISATPPGFVGSLTRVKIQEIDCGTTAAATNTTSGVKNNQSTNQNSVDANMIVSRPPGLSVGVFGNKSTYLPGETVSIQVKGIENFDGSAGEVSEGYNVQVYVTGVGDNYNTSGVNAVYNKQTGYWDASMPVPSDASKSYKAEVVFYCATGTGEVCRQRASATGGQVQVSTSFVFSISSTTTVSNCRINSFVATPSSVVAGEPSTLSWTASNCSDVTLSNFGGSSKTGQDNRAKDNTSGSIVVYPLPGNLFYISGYNISGANIANSSNKTVSVAVTPSTTVLPTTSYDVNGDGLVNVADFQILHNAIMSIDTTCGTRCDVNGDGSVNVADLQKMINFFQGKNGGIPSFVNAYDVNTDGSVDVADFQTVYVTVMGMSAACGTRCDLNSDGSVNVADLQKMINYLLGISSASTSTPISASTKISLVIKVDASSRPSENIPAGTTDFETASFNFSSYDYPVTVTGLEMSTNSDKCEFTNLKLFSDGVQIGSTVGKATLIPSRGLCYAEFQNLGFTIPKGVSKLVNLKVSIPSDASNSSFDFTVGSVYVKEQNVSVSMPMSRPSTMNIVAKQTTGVSVLSPNGGESYKIGSVVPIKWNAYGLTTGNNNVAVMVYDAVTRTGKIALSQYGSNTVLANGQISDTGTLNWTIPSNLSPGNYLVYLSSSTGWDESNAAFSITAQ